MESPILQPVAVLVLWSLVMLAWLYAERIPAIRAARLPLTPDRTRADLDAALPTRVRFPADNYVHLMEQPTLFYAVALALAFLGQGAGLNATLAWAYVAIRIAHSLIQATLNPIPIRFLVFNLASLVLVALAVRLAMAVF